jgi:hypothetical protein
MDGLRAGAPRGRDDVGDREMRTASSQAATCAAPASTSE